MNDGSAQIGMVAAINPDATDIGRRTVRIQEACEALQGMNVKAAAIYRRIYGPSPETDGPTPAPNKPDGLLHTMDMQLDNLHHQISRLSNALNELDNL